MQYKVTISKTNKTFPIKGLNELLKAETHTWDARMKKTVVSNKVKADNDKTCRLAIQRDLRGVKIDNEYVDDADNAKVTLTVKNATFATESKAAILVKSPAGAEVNLENVDISNVKADTTNTVWVDEDAAAYASGVVVNGGTVIVEP